MGVEEQGEITNSNIIKYLGVIEQRVDELSFFVFRRVRHSLFVTPELRSRAVVPPSSPL